MALIKCPECGKMISDRAVSCPNCGFPITGNQGVFEPQQDNSSTADFSNSETQPTPQQEYGAQQGGYYSAPMPEPAPMPNTPPPKKKGFPGVIVLFIFALIFCWCGLGIVFAAIGLIVALAANLKRDDGGKKWLMLFLPGIALVLSILFTAARVSLRSTSDSNQTDSLSVEEEVIIDEDAEITDDDAVEPDNENVEDEDVDSEDAEDADAEDAEITADDFEDAAEIEDADSGELSEDEYKASCETVSYKDLCRTPDAYEGINVEFTGEIFQVQESGNLAVYLISVTKGDYYWDDHVWVDYDLSNSDIHFLEDDIVTFYGEFVGMRSYETVLGQELSVPEVDVLYMELNE